MIFAKLFELLGMRNLVLSSLNTAGSLAARKHTTVTVLILRNYQRDGPMNVTSNHDGAPNYFPNSFSGPNVDR